MSVHDISPTRGVDFLQRRPQLWIDGSTHEPRSGKWIDVYDPATGIAFTQTPLGDATDIDLAVRAARRSFDAGVWSRMPAGERARIMWRLADLLESHASDLITIEVLNNGMPLPFAKWTIDSCSEWLRHFSGLTTQIFGTNASASVSAATSRIHAYTAREPVGVAGLIIPWNGPAGALVIKLCPALAAGCSVVVKPSELTPISALMIAELAHEAGLPSGVLNVVPGLGEIAGQALVEHPLVDKISFTGSTAVGKHVVRSASATLKRVTLELGGKSPCIIFNDANLETAIPAASMAIFANTGQVCFAGSRLFVQEQSYDAVVAGISRFAAGLKIGSGFEPDTMIGPLISEKQRERVSKYIDSGRKNGAAIVTGGGTIDRKGYFVQPTVFANAAADLQIVREEIFGPVLVVTPWSDWEDLLRIANDTRYGLGAGIFTSNLASAHLTAERLQAGTIWVNSYGLMHPAMPFGGFKESGWGREMGSEGLDAFLEKKSVYMALR